MARAKTRHRLMSSEETKRWHAEAGEIAERQRQYHVARRAYSATRQRLDELRQAHAVLVDVVAEAAGVPIGTPGAVPSGLHVPGHRELVEKIHAVQPWLPPREAHVRGAVDDDSPDVVRVLIALDRGHSLTAACELAIGAKSAKRSKAGNTLRLRVVRTGAYARWREALAHQLAVAPLVSVAGETREDYEHRVAALRKLAAQHRRRRS